jgi:hypothetical protein
MVEELGENLKGNGRGLIEILSLHLHKRTVECHQKPQPGYLMSQPRLKQSASPIQV